MEALKRDILNKYQQNMPQAASDYWRSWLENVEREIAAAPDHYVWLVDTLKTAGRTAPPPLAAQIPNDLLELKEREIQPTQEIYTGGKEIPEKGKHQWRWWMMIFLPLWKLAALWPCILATLKRS